MAGSMEGTRSETGRRSHLVISQAGCAAGWCEVWICVWGMDAAGIGGSAEKGQGMDDAAGGRMLSSSPPEENHQGRRNHTYPVPNGI